MDPRLKRYLNLPYGVVQEQTWKRDAKRVERKIRLAQRLWEELAQAGEGGDLTPETIESGDNLLEQIDDMTIDYSRIKSEHEELIHDEKELDRLIKECMEKYCSTPSLPS